MRKVVCYGRIRSTSTRYGEVSDGSSVFHVPGRNLAYARLSESEKLDLLQEVVNRDAMEKGR